MRRRIYEIIEVSEDGDSLSKAYDIFMIKLISSCLEVFAVCACYIELQYNKEEDKDLILLERGELEWN